MNNTQSSLIVREIRAGFLSPFDSLKFLSRHKFLLVIGLAPHIAGLAAYLWVFFQYGLDFIHTQLAQFVGPNAMGSTQVLIDIGLFIVATLLYGILGLPFVNVVASPVYDVIAERAYRAYAPQTPLPKLGIADFVRSFLSECSKLVFVTSCFIVLFFIPALTPLGFLGSLWFFGWDHMDRTLSLINMPFKRRLVFGLRHSLACLSLGVWSYVPLVGTLLSFAMACSGALTVAQVQTARDLRHLLDPKEKEL